MCKYSIRVCADVAFNSSPTYPLSSRIFLHEAQIGIKPLRVLTSARAFWSCWMSCSCFFFASTNLLTTKLIRMQLTPINVNSTQTSLSENRFLWSKITIGSDIRPVMIPPINMESISTESNNAQEKDHVNRHVRYRHGCIRRHKTIIPIVGKIAVGK